MVVVLCLVDQMYLIFQLEVVLEVLEVLEVVVLEEKIYLVVAQFFQVLVEVVLLNHLKVQFLLEQD
jgi:hypothetical protein